MTQGKVAMWYDATSARRLARGGRLPGQGQDRLRPGAGRARPESSGWLYTWAWGIQKASKNQDNAWKFISWASSKEYEKLVGEQLGWSERARPASAPRPTRTPSTSRRPRRFAGADQGGHRAAPTRRTPACSRGRRSASSSSTSRSSPTSAPRSRQDVSSAIAGQDDRRRGPERGPGAGRGRRRASTSTESAVTTADDRHREPHGGRRPRRAAPAQGAPAPAGRLGRAGPRCCPR